MPARNQLAIFSLGQIHEIVRAKGLDGPFRNSQRLARIGDDSHTHEHAGFQLLIVIWQDRTHTHGPGYRINGIVDAVDDAGKGHAFQVIRRRGDFDARLERLEKDGRHGKVELHLAVVDQCCHDIAWPDIGSDTDHAKAENTRKRRDEHTVLLAHLNCPKLGISVVEIAPRGIERRLSNRILSG